MNDLVSNFTGSYSIRANRWPLECENCRESLKREDEIVAALSGEESETLTAYCTDCESAARSLSDDEILVTGVIHGLWGLTDTGRAFHFEAEEILPE